MEAWHDFWVAQVGASAALAGLLFVSISINLTKILSNPELADRAGVPLVLLLGILISCSLLLAPDPTITRTGLETLLCGLAVWGVVTFLDIKRLRKTAKSYWKTEPLKLALTQVASIPYIIGGIFIFTGDLGGLDWTVVAIVASFLKVFSDAWVLLVEINR